MIIVWCAIGHTSLRVELRIDSKDVMFWYFLQSVVVVIIDPHLKYSFQLSRILSPLQNFEYVGLSFDTIGCGQ
jgi:hypothetical protein